MTPATVTLKREIEDLWRARHACRSDAAADYLRDQIREKQAELDAATAQRDACLAPRPVN